MTASPKIVERVNKLLRLAAPSGGSTEGERTSAALEAAKLISEHGLTVAEPPPPPPKNQRPPQPRRARPKSRPVDRPGKRSETWAPVAQDDDWFPVDVASAVACVACGVPIWPGEEAFFSSRFGYRHHDISCSE